MRVSNFFEIECSCCTAVLPHWTPKTYPLPYHSHVPLPALNPLLLFHPPHDGSNDLNKKFNSEGQTVGTNRSGNSLEVSAASGKKTTRTMEEEEAAKRDRLTSL